MLETSRIGIHSATLACLTAAVVFGTSAPEAAERVIAADGARLQVAIDDAEAGDILVLAPGVHAGPIRVDKTLTLRGRGARIDGGGTGSAVTVSAPGARIEGLAVFNSGEDVGRSDACIYVDAAATGAVIDGNTLSRCAFGIWVHETAGVTIAHNRVSSRSELRTTDRGNGIHLFDASKLVVRDNEVHDARDGIYVSATEDSLIAGNRTSQVRYGIHYMYSYRNEVRGNVANDDTIGLALMESHDLIVEDNVAMRNERNGLLFRDVEDSQVRRNHLEANGNGMFFFSSVRNVIEDNLLIDNEMGLKIWAGTKDNRIEGNVIRGNRQQVFYVGAEDQVWGETGRGNHWSDYLGWDQDGDGIGDRPHRVDSFTANLLYRYPTAVLLLRSPALEMLAHLSDMMPMLRTPTVIDVAPLVDEPAS
jgi:nitrous oxidase accessory protein